MGFNFRGLFIESLGLVYKGNSYKDCSFVLINVSAIRQCKSCCMGIYFKYITIVQITKKKHPASPGCFCFFMGFVWIIVLL